MKRAIVAAGLLGVAACLAGCGGGKAATPKETYAAWAKAVQAGNADEAMACLSKEAQKLKGGAVLESMTAWAKEGSPKFGKEEITGGKATLEVTSAKGETKVFHFVDEDGKWKLAAEQSFAVGGSSSASSGPPKKLKTMQEDVPE